MLKQSKVWVVAIVKIFLELFSGFLFAGLVTGVLGGVFVPLVSCLTAWPLAQENRFFVAEFGLCLAQKLSMQAMQLFAFCKCFG